MGRGSERYVPTASDHAVRCSRPADRRRAVDHGLLLRLHAYYTASAAFSRAPLAAKLLIPYHAQLQHPDGSQHQINGFQSADEKAFRVMPAKTVTDWRAKGWLNLVTLRLASQVSKNLLGLNAQRANERKALV